MVLTLRDSVLQGPFLKLERYLNLRDLPQVESPVITPHAKNILEKAAPKQRPTRYKHKGKLAFLRP